MPEYIVRVREVWVQDVRVEADSPEEAKDEAAVAGGIYLDNTLVYSHSLESDTWTVEEE